MISVTSGFLEAMEYGIFTRTAVITLADGTELDPLGEDDFTVDNSSFTDAAGQATLPVGVALSRTIQLELLNDDNRYADISFTGAEIDLSLSLLVSGETETVQIGHFTVLSPEAYGDTVILTAQDNMYLADRPFTSSLSYPTTAGALWAEMCSICGITNGMTTIPQEYYAIPQKPSSDLTFRSLFGYIAMLSGGNARISRTGEIEIVNYDFSTLETQRTAGTAVGIHDLTDWRSLKLDREDITVTGIQTTIYDGEKSYEIVAGSEGYVLSLENPLFGFNYLYPGTETSPASTLNPGTQEYAAIANIATALTGHAFRGFTGEYFEYPLAEFGDVARITDANGNTYYTILTDIEFTWFSPTNFGCRASSPLQSISSYVPQDAQTIKRASQMIRASMVNDLRLFGSMRVYTDAAFEESAGEIGYTTDESATNIGQGIVMWSGNRSVIITGNDKLFIGFHSDDDPWFDGGAIKINSANYQNFIKFEDGIIEEGPGGEQSIVATGAQLYINASGIHINNREILEEIGTLANLTTTAKTSLVAAINELVTRVHNLETQHTYPG